MHTQPCSCSRSRTRARRWRLDLKPRTDVALVAFAAFLSYACGGCLSNEYVIPKAELARLAQLPPEQRGQRVQVVQDIGDRRGEAIDVNQPAPPPGAPQGGEYGAQPEGYVEQSGPPVGVMIVAPPPPIFIGPPLPGPPFGPPLPGMGGPLRAAPRPPMGGVPGRAAPVTPHGPGRGGVGGLGKGGSGKDDLIALILVFAVLATVGMIATEGSRYDGYVAMYPWQPVHLTDGSGAQREVPLAELSPADVASATKATVMDDEGWGMQRLGRKPLDRQGFAFKLNMGILHSSCSCAVGDAFGANMQVGYFPHHFVGLLASWTIAGGNDINNDSFYRNNLAVEAQVFPLNIWRLHLGGFGHAGVQYSDDTGFGARSGAAFGGGLLLEIELTSRLALMGRADFTTARTAGAGSPWDTTQMYTAGVAIY